MTSYQPPAPEDELEQRREQLAAREGKPGYGENVKALKARIAELEAQIAGNG